ncbi:MAG: hypothetical protein MJ252_26500 [archaeon]|nr:hypothetical protein [archaeon]
MEEEDDSSRTALKVVFILSTVLVLMDIAELYLSYNSLFDYAIELTIPIFEQCAKYHIITQMFFTGFATLAGLSACLMSFGLLLNYQLFADKFLDTFIYYNFYSFGPFLLGCSILGFVYFDEVCYNCDSENYQRRFLNISTLACLVISFTISTFITMAYTIIGTKILYDDSLRFKPDGNYFLGKVFWKYVFNRGRETVAERNRNENENNQNDLSQSLNPGSINQNNTTMINSQIIDGN